LEKEEGGRERKRGERISSSSSIDKNGKGMDDRGGEKSKEKKKKEKEGRASFTSAICPRKKKKRKKDLSFRWEKKKKVERGEEKKKREEGTLLSQPHAGKKKGPSPTITERETGIGAQGRKKRRENLC